MNDDQQALHNRLKQNQAYNDHIVAQQNAIVKQFDKIGDLEKKVSELENSLLALQSSHNSLNGDHKDVAKTHSEDIFCLSDDVKHLGDFHVDLKLAYDDLKSTYEKSTVETLNLIKYINDRLDLYSSLLDSNNKNILLAFEIFKKNIIEEMDAKFLELNKQIPETPPYIQDLKDTINHKIRVFEIDVATAVDKANHAEMLYKVVEKRTRQ